MLIPFLILAIGVSHGVQIALSNVRLVGEGMSALRGRRGSFHNLLEPGVVALVLAVLTFVTVTTIPVPAIRELALTAAIGIAVAGMVTNLLGFAGIGKLRPHLRAPRRKRQARRGSFRGHVARARRPDRAQIRRSPSCVLTFGVTAAAAVLLGQPVVGDTHIGVAGTASAKPLQPGRGLLPEQLHRQHRHPAGHRRAVPPTPA